jgi:hypothetical protein
MIVIEEKIWDFTVEIPIRHSVREAHENFLIGLEPFLISLENPRNVGPAKSGAGGVIHLHQPGYRKPYYRLFYPNHF